MNITFLKKSGDNVKIEMAESLIRSWARHCVGCQVAELNWKPSFEGIWPSRDTAENSKLFEEAKTFFYDKLRSEIFKKTTSVEQMLRQAEIDVLALRVNAGVVEKVVAVDVAFHTGGLLYGDKEETAGRVAKKLFRTALITDSFFHGVKTEAVFAAPKVHPASLEILRNAESAINQFFRDKRENLSFRVIVNGDFSKEILEPVRALSESVADTSELFLRAMQMVKMFEVNRAQGIPSEVRKNEPPKATSQTQIPSAKRPQKYYDLKTKANLVAYYLSKFDHPRLGVGNQGETFAFFARALGIKESSIRTTRDQFDPYTGSHRKGFHQNEPSSEKMEIHRDFKNTSEEELRRLILGFVQR